MKAFIEANFKVIDLNGDGIVSAPEFRYNCITRIAVENIKQIDDAFESLLNVSLASRYFNAFFHNFFFLYFIHDEWQDDDRRRGGLTLSRYQELYGHYLGNPSEEHPGVHLFGPLSL